MWCTAAPWATRRRGRRVARRAAGRCALERRRVASAVEPPAATVWDPSEFLDINMDEFAGPIPHVAPDWFFGGPVANIEATQSSGSQDVLNGRSCKTRLVGDVVSTPAALFAEPDALGAPARRYLVRRPTRPRRTVLQAWFALGQESVPPFPDCLRVDLEPLGGLLDTPTIVDHRAHHVQPVPWCEPRVGVLGFNVRHEPSV